MLSRQMLNERYVLRVLALVLIAGACSGSSGAPAPESTSTSGVAPVTTSSLVVASTAPASTTTTTAPVDEASEELTDFLITTYEMLADRLVVQADPVIASDPQLGLERMAQFSDEWLSLRAPEEAQQMYLDAISVWTALLSGYENWVSNNADAGDDETFLRLSFNEFQRVLNKFARNLAVVQASQAELSISVLSGRVSDPAAAYTVETLRLDIASTDASNRILAGVGALNSLADQDAVRADLASAVEDFAAFAERWRELDVPPEFVDLNGRIVDGIDTTASLYREMLAVMDTDAAALDVVVGQLQTEGRSAQRLAVDRLRNLADVLRGSSN